MRFIRIYRLLIGLTLFTWTSASAASTSVRSATGKEDQSPTILPGVYCPKPDGISWTLFREKCYFRYSAPFGIEETSEEDADKHYKTWFEAREECAKLGAKLASIHDQATHDKLLSLIPGNETVTSPEEITWIGLQVGTLHEVTIDSNGVRVVNETGCYWPADVCPRLKEYDPDPKNTVDKCSITYNETFHGKWEDGKLYNKAESAAFWIPGEPSDRYIRRCQGVIFNADEQSQAYCERGPNGKRDGRRHCAQILPADEKRIENDDLKPSAGKWTDYWCWMKVRGYICERPAMRSGTSEDSTAPSLTSGGVGTETSATPASCGTRLDDCRKSAWRRIDEIEGEINATGTGFSEVIDTMVLGGAAPGAPWLGSASFGHLARSAIDFGRSLAKLSAEECVPEPRGLRLHLLKLSEKVEGSEAKIDADFWTSRGNLLSKIERSKAFISSYLKYRLNIRTTVKTMYQNAGRTLRPGNDTGKEYYHRVVMSYCERNELPEELITNMTSYFVSSTSEDESSGDFDLNLLSDLANYEPDSKTIVRLLMTEVDTDARLALTSLGVCTHSLKIPTGVKDESSKKAIQSLSKVSDAFKRALRNDTPPWTIAPPIPYGKDVVAIMNQTARNVLNETKKGELNAKGWSGREELHEEIVNGTVDALNNRASGYVFNALAYLLDDRDDQQCRKFSDGNFVDVGYENLNFFVLYANASVKHDADKAWNNTKNKADAVLDHVLYVLVHWPSTAAFRPLN